MPLFSHKIGQNLIESLGENIDGSALPQRRFYTFNGTDNYIITAYTQIAIGDIVTFKMFTTSNPSATATVFDGQNSTTKLIVGTGGALTATGGTVLPATLDTSGDIIEYTFTATAAGSIETIGANEDGLGGYASFPILDVFVNGEGVPIDDGWNVDPLIRGNVYNTGASNGATTYDRKTRVYLDYETEIDPKYGDVAADLAEAEARADEGIMPNGDFRDGTIAGWTAYTGAAISYNTSSIEITTSTNGGAYRDITVIANTPYRVTATSLEDVAQGRLFLYNGANFTSALLDSFNRLQGTKSFIVTPTVTTMRIYLGNTGPAGTVNYSELEVNTATSEIVDGPTVGNGTANAFVEQNWSRLGEPPGTPFVDSDMFIDSEIWID